MPRYLFIEPRAVCIYRNSCSVCLFHHASTSTAVLLPRHRQPRSEDPAHKQPHVQPEETAIYRDHCLDALEDNGRCRSHLGTAVAGLNLLSLLLHGMRPQAPTRVSLSGPRLLREACRQKRSFFTQMSSSLYDVLQSAGPRLVPELPTIRGISRIR